MAGDAAVIQSYPAADDTSRTVFVKRMSSGRAHNVQVRVLVVEDHVALANRIGEGLRDAGFAVDVVYDGAAALDSTAGTDYDVVVLDRDLPAIHGDRVCRQLVRDGSPSRILMLTAAADVEDRVDGLELGEVGDLGGASHVGDGREERVLDGGPTLGRPDVDLIKGSRHHNMKELRVGASVRALFVFDQRDPLMLIGGDKRGAWSAWYPRTIRDADRLYDQHRRDNGKGGSPRHRDPPSRGR